MRQKHGYIRKGWSLLLIMIPTQHYQFPYIRGHIAGNDRTSAIGRMNDKTQAPDQALSTLVVLEVEEVSLIGVLGIRFVVGGALRPRCRPKITSKSILTHPGFLSPHRPKHHRHCHDYYQKCEQDENILIKYPPRNMYILSTDTIYIRVVGKIALTWSDPTPRWTSIVDECFAQEVKGAER